MVKLMQYFTSNFQVTMSLQANNRYTFFFFSFVEYLSMNGDASWVCRDPDPQTKELFLPFRCFLTRKDVSCFFLSFLVIISLQTLVTEQFREEKKDRLSGKFLRF